MPEGLELAGAVEQGGLVQTRGQRLEKSREDEHREGEPECQINEEQTGPGIEQVHGAKLEEERNDRKWQRDHQPAEEVKQDRLGEGELEARDGVRGHGCEKSRRN